MSEQSMSGMDAFLEETGETEGDLGDELAAKANSGPTAELLDDKGEVHQLTVVEKVGNIGLSVVNFGNIDYGVTKEDMQAVAAEYEPITKLDPFVDEEYEKIKAAGLKLVKVRTGLDGARKDFGRNAHAHIKKAKKKAEDLGSIVLPIEVKLKALRKKRDDHEAMVTAAAEKAEEDRQRYIQDIIDHCIALPGKLIDESSVTINGWIATTDKLAATASDWADEYAEAAKISVKGVMINLQSLFTMKQQQAEAEKVKAEQDAIAVKQAEANAKAQATLDKMKERFKGRFDAYSDLCERINYGLDDGYETKEAIMDDIKSLEAFTIEKPWEGYFMDDEISAANLAEAELFKSRLMERFDVYDRRLKEISERLSKEEYEKASRLISAAVAKTAYTADDCEALISSIASIEQTVASGSKHGGQIIKEAVEATSKLKERKAQIIEQEKKAAAEAKEAYAIGEAKRQAREAIVNLGSADVNEMVINLRADGMNFKSDSSAAIDTYKSIIGEKITECENYLSRQAELEAKRQEIMEGIALVLAKRYNIQLELATQMVIDINQNEIVNLAIV